MGVILILYSHVHSSPYLFVCDDDRIIYYPRADDLTGERRDAWVWRVGLYGHLKTLNFMIFSCFWTLAILAFINVINLDYKHL